MKGTHDNLYLECWWQFYILIFDQSSNIKYHKNPPSGRRVISYWRTDVTKLIIAFRNVAKSRPVVALCPQPSWTFSYIVSVEYVSNRILKLSSAECDCRMSWFRVSSVHVSIRIDRLECRLYHSTVQQQVEATRKSWMRRHCEAPTC